MKVINTFMHDGRVLRPGDAIPNNVSDGELLAWKNNGLIGNNYDGPTRRSQPEPSETKPTGPARKPAAPKAPKPVADPKPAETKGATDKEATGADAESTSDKQAPQDQKQQTQAATDAVADAGEAKPE